MVASNCPEKGDLVPLAYERLDPELRTRLEKHLAECPACRQEVAGLKAVRGALADGSLPGVRLPREDDFVGRVMTTVRLQPVSARRPSTSKLARRPRPAAARVWLRLLVSAAAAGLVIGAGWGLLRGRDAGRGKPPANVPGPAAVAAEISVEKLLEQAERAGSGEQLRALSGPLARAADLEAAKPNLCFEKWSYLTLAESLACSADRAAYRPALVGALRLAAESKSPAAPSGAGGPAAPAVQILRDNLSAGRASESGFLVAKLPADAPESPVIAGRVLSRRVREALAAGPLTGQAWEQAKGLGTLGFGGKGKGLASDLACIVRGDLAAAALDYDLAVAEWRAAEDSLAADRPELAASLALRAACVTLLPRGRARDAGEMLKRLEERHGKSAAAALCRRELSVTFAAEAQVEAERAKAFLTAMGIPFDLRRQVLTPLGTPPGLSGESVLVSNYDLKDMVVLLQFLRPLPLSGSGRGTVVTGQVRLLACSAVSPMEVLVCAQAGGGGIAVAKVEPPLPGMTYHLRVALWDAGAGSPPGLQVSSRPEGRPADPAGPVVRAGEPPRAARPGAERACAVLCLGKNVAQMELANLQLQTDVDLAAPAPR